MKPTHNLIDTSSALQNRLHAFPRLSLMMTPVAASNILTDYLTFMTKVIACWE